MDHVQVLTTEPELRERASGGWLAVSRRTPRIAVAAADEDSARREFRVALEHWARLLEDAEHGSHPS